MVTTPKEEVGFLSRWSKRKRAVADGEELPDINPTDDAPVNETEAISAERAAELEENRLAAEAIDIEKLDYDSDFTAFFKDGVPSVLRQKAMRLLWRSNPLLANVDGLCDYDDNFADPSLILKKFESAYQIGKGYIFDEEPHEEKLAEATGLEDDEDDLQDPGKAPGDNDEHIQNTDNTSLSDKHLTQTTQEGDFLEGETSHKDETAMPEDFDDEPDTLEPARPRVSLRKRLQFET